MTLDLNKEILALDSTPLLDNEKPLTMAVFISKLLVADTKGDSIKVYDWALTLYSGKPIEVDKSDLKTIRDFVEGHPMITNLAKAQIINYLDTIK